MKLKCIVVDDEPLAVEELTYILSMIDGVEVISSANTGSKAIELINKLMPDVVFLDIQMPGKDGFAVAREISRREPSPIIIFATAYDEYAIKGFEEGALDYVLKPFSKERIKKSIDRVKRILEGPHGTEVPGELQKVLESIGSIEKSPARLALESRGRIVLVGPEEVFYFNAKDKKIYAYGNENSLLGQINFSLDELETKLKPFPFFRTHRSYLVNLTHVRELIPWYNGRYIVVMKDGCSTEIPVSRNRVKDLKEHFCLA
jgi:two-component system LytT family response regulator/two-component system response regulator LytT